ncbi:hypothetical protein [Labrenzia sp. DG1229]|uniref:hypothetical protein n=1 Tax=Labrenzia sp. DG1229 TaxID=681847 RepID=UPI0006906581|nr:hypothetical protein [Labrenzia sp. DG1229]
MSEEWFAHFAPPVMHEHFRLFDHLYREWLGRELMWERQGKSHFARFAKKIVMAALKNETIFSPIGHPQPIIEIFIQSDFGGHNSIAKVMPLNLREPIRPSDTYSDGNGRLVTAASNGGIKMHPAFVFSLGEFDERRAGFAKRMTLSINAQHLFRPPMGSKRSPPLPLTVYRHSFNSTADLSGHRLDQFYIGVTRRSWKKRWKEHMRSMTNGSGLKFHRAFRAALSRGGANDVSHEVMWVGEDEEEMLAFEEEAVNCYLKSCGCLNMIPGGKKGLKYLHVHGMLGRNTHTSAVQNEKILEAFLRQNPRKGEPAPWVAENWKDDEWAIANICGREGRLKPKQVRTIRELAADHTSAEIAQEIGALNVGQVERVMKGQTYTRVK